MLEKITFKNHINEEMLWGENNVYVNYNDLHDYLWSYTNKNNKASNFTKGIVTKSVPIVIVCPSEEEGLQVKNNLFEMAEKDVLAEIPGRLYIGDYYLSCYIIGSSKSEYLRHKGYMETTLKVISDTGNWVKESLVSFRRGGIVVGQTSANELDGLDYNYDFPFDYTSDMTNKTINNTGFVGTNFKMIIYGTAVNPAIHIGGHAYQVNCSIEEGEYLTIDSIEKTVVLTRQDGTTVNKFNDRSRESYIFEPIPPGDNSVVWDDNYGFDLILFEERSEPKWT